ncbi:U2 snRNP component ist3 [Elsinoe australis]|uniref:U2 snRNP component ist3 n=1 Tax=Elsinoe australis TaxID=40998 RepID=A0A2P7Z2Q7_9PEZI|nr:U2 snRNP component ist3 [Elsinoe australis]
MQSIKQVQRLNQRELDNAVPSSASWHTDYRDTAYIYIGGIPLDLSEGDVITIFSQYGEPVWIKLARDKDTGKSRGFAWLKYEDQRSCDLAVDNLSGAEVMGRMLAVDHARYKRRDDENEADGYVGQDRFIEAEDGDRKRKKQYDVSESESEEERPRIREELELAKLMEDHDDDDPMKAYMIEQKKEEVAEALKAVVKSGEIVTGGEDRAAVGTGIDEDKGTSHARGRVHRSDETDELGAEFCRTLPMIPQSMRMSMK